MDITAADAVEMTDRHTLHMHCCCIHPHTATILSAGSHLSLSLSSSLHRFVTATYSSCPHSEKVLSVVQLVDKDK